MTVFDRGEGMREVRPVSRPPVDDASIRERMDAESPDGRPPTEKLKRGERWVFVVALGAVFVGIIWVVYASGGIIPAAIALALALVFIGLAAWPTWHAAYSRDHDTRKVRGEIDAERRGPQVTRL